jgi:ketosteroid isomerase-like protein
MKKVITLCALVAVLTAVSALASPKKQSDADAVAAITQMENDNVKADLSGDSSFIQKNYADDYTMGFSGGRWETKDSLLADAKDPANNKMNSEQISDLKVRIYGDTAIATYKDNYDATIRGEHRAKTVLTTDTFARQNGAWKLVASHSSVAGD